MKTNEINTISENLIASLNNAFGSKHEFEKNLIYEAYKAGNKGKVFLGMDRFFNLRVSANSLPQKVISLLECNLNRIDILNFIEDLDYIKLSKSYEESLKLLKS